MLRKELISVVLGCEELSRLDHLHASHLISWEEQLYGRAAQRAVLH